MNKNAKLLKDFIKYCKANPEQRFWQALRNWSGYAFILAKKSLHEEVIDTFYLKDKNK